MWGDIIKRNVIIALLAATVMFIFIQSMLPAKISGSESRKVTDKVVNPITNAVAPGKSVGNDKVRKYAHAAEYALMGAELALLMKKYWICLNLGLITAVFDETIQLLRNRGSSVKDIWIDMLGICIGMIIVIMITCIKKSRQNKG